MLRLLITVEKEQKQMYFFRAFAPIFYFELGSSCCGDAKLFLSSGAGALDTTLRRFN